MCDTKLRFALARVPRGAGKEVGGDTTHTEFDVNKLSLAPLYAICDTLLPLCRLYSFFNFTTCFAAPEDALVYTQDKRDTSASQNGTEPGIIIVKHREKRWIDRMPESTRGAYSNKERAAPLPYESAAALGHAPLAKGAEALFPPFSALPRIGVLVMVAKYAK